MCKIAQELKVKGNIDTLDLISFEIVVMKNFLIGLCSPSDENDLQ